MTRHFDYCLSASEGDNQSVRSSAPVVSRCFPGGYNVKLYISRGRLAWWLLAFLHSVNTTDTVLYVCTHWVNTSVSAQHDPALCTALLISIMSQAANHTLFTDSAIHTCVQCVHRTLLETGTHMATCLRSICLGFDSHFEY